jgi:hypothetical protein
MADQYKSKRYFKQYNHETTSYVTFASVEDAQTKIGFGDCWNTSSPVKSYALEDAGQTLVVTHEFTSEADQNAFMTALASAWSDASIFSGNTSKTLIDGVTVVPVLECRRVKTEWLHQDGSVSSTTNFTFE